ncbi:MAG: phosphodiester glycosidase family protein, partial [Planctomycetes bacterium]|nr:phosphodiester glycosidase family protein [Planctomycetota bacterium]
AWPAVSAIGAGPVLLADGAPRITWEEEVFFGSGIGAVDEPQPRSAIGITAAGHLVLVVVQGRAVASRGATLPDLARLLQDLGAVAALNLDGGGSAALAIGGELESGLPDGTVERPVATVLALVPK